VQNGGVTQGKRDRYHHGDLANALQIAATELARKGGPEAVVLREAARTVGVSATAAYRHFAGHGELIRAVKEEALRTLAAHMADELTAGPAQEDPIAEAIRRLRTLGRGYVRFALAEPGLFRTAFCRGGDQLGDVTAGMLDTPSFLMLSHALDELVELGAVPAQRRVHAEMFAWSGTHGLSMLLLDGPLRHLPADAQEAVVERTLDGIVSGLIPAAP
jgi:AcrR family transcriptional regulator